MTDTEHTPGPWERVAKSVYTTGNPTFEVVHEVRGKTPEQAKANAALIASAPTLRAERDELIGFIEDEAQLIAYDDDTTHDELCIMVDQFRHKASAFLNRIT